MQYRERVTTGQRLATTVPQVFILDVATTPPAGGVMPPALPDSAAQPQIPQATNRQEAQ